MLSNSFVVEKFVFILHFVCTVKMLIDKNWMFIKDRWQQEWQLGMKVFLDMAFEKVVVAKEEYFFQLAILENIITPS